MNLKEKKKKFNIYLKSSHQKKIILFGFGKVWLLEKYFFVRIFSMNQAQIRKRARLIVDGK